MWGQNEQKISQTFILQKKDIGLLSFAHFQANSSPLFKKQKILKLTDIISLNNILFTHNTLNNNTPIIFKDYFKFKEVRHEHQTINRINSTYSIPEGSLELPTFRTTTGKLSLKNVCSNNWNKTLKDLSLKYLEKYISNQNWLNNCKISYLKHMLKNNFLDHY